ncbi:hypothetical protein J7L85_00575 [candidate division WOR-3 bacterium]|nr:hypothetical protein [candidate division WOR-3 bacterium]
MRTVKEMRKEALERWIFSGEIDLHEYGEFHPYLDQKPFIEGFEDHQWVEVPGTWKKTSGRKVYAILSFQWDEFSPLAWEDWTIEEM